MNTLTHQQLSEILPHAFPFLLIDKVVDYKKDEYLVAEKCVTANEWCFAQVNEGLAQNTTSSEARGLVVEEGLHIFPETLLIEAAAQTAAVLYHVSRIKGGKRPQYRLGQAKAEFSDSIFVGDRIALKAKGTKMLTNIGLADIEVSRAGQNLAHVAITYGIQ